MANTYKVVWRYKTPLQGEYIAAFLGNGIGPGLTKPVSISSTNQGYDVNQRAIYLLSGTEVFIAPYLKPELICKIRSDSDTIISNVPSGENSKGIVYMLMQWRETGSTEPVVTVQYAAFSKNSSGNWVLPTIPSAAVVLCYYENNRVYPYVAQFCPEYWRRQSRSGYFLRQSLPTDSTFTPESVNGFTLSSVGGEAVHTLLPCFSSSDSRSYLVEASTSVVLSDITSNKYHLIGYQLQLTSTPGSGFTCPLQVLASATTMQGLVPPAHSVSVAVVQWKGTAGESVVYPMNDSVASSPKSTVEQVLHAHALI